MQGIPDELRLSTALSIEEGHVHWRGDWPAAEILAILKGVGSARADPR
jgi:hypothetical protein